MNRRPTKRPLHQADISTVPDSWLCIAQSFARDPIICRLLDRYAITLETLTIVLAAEARGANKTGVSALSPNQISDLTRVSLSDVLRIRAALFHFGLLTAAIGSSCRVQLEIPWA